MTEVELSAQNVQALATLVPYATDADMRGVGSYEDALALAEAIHGNVVDISEELGSGFAMLEDKSVLVKQKFVILQWRFSPGDYLKGFVSVGLVTSRGDKYIMNDGSTGIYDTLLEFSQETQRFGGIVVPKGLRRSEYPTCPECGKPMPKDVVECETVHCNYDGEKRSIGETFYLDTSADEKTMQNKAAVK